MASGVCIMWGRLVRVGLLRRSTIKGLMMDRLPLASGEDLLHMSRDEKYSRYLYDLETVYTEVISTLGAGTSQVWEVEQTGGMCCVLSAHVKGSRNGVSGCFEFMVCPDGNLSIDDDPQHEEYVVGFMFCDEDGPIDDGEVLYGVSYSDLVSRVLDFMTAQGVK